MTGSSLQPLVTLRGHSGIVWCVSWSPRGLLASCGADRTVRIWGPSGGDSNRYDAQKWTCITLLGGETFLRTVRNVTWAPDGRTLATAGFDALGNILELIGGEKPRLEAVVELPGHMSEVKSVAFSSSGGLLATCSRDRSIWLWEAGADFDYECIEVLNGHTADVKTVVWHPRVELLVSTSYDDTVRVWAEDLDEWYCVQELVEHSSTVWDAAFDRIGHRLVTVSGDASVVVWRRFPPTPGKIGATPRFKVVCRKNGVHSKPIYAVDWATSTGFIATGGGDDCIQILAQKGNENGRQNDQDERDGDMETDEYFSEADTAKASDSEDYVYIASATRAHTGDVNSVAWHPKDGRFLASAGDDGLVRLFTLIAGSP